MFVRRGGGGGGCCDTTTKAKGPSTARLYQPGVKLVVRRAPLLSGLSANARLQKKFQPPNKAVPQKKRRCVVLRNAAAAANAPPKPPSGTLGQRRRMDGMSRLLARAGKGLHFKMPAANKSGSGTEESDSEGSDDEEEKEPEKPFEPLCVWTSPHEGGEAKGLPSRAAAVTRPDEYGIEETVTVLQPAPIEAYAKQSVLVPPVLAKWLRPHQREGVEFMYQCVMGLKATGGGNGCILADDMGLGKTLQSVALIYTLLKTSITANNVPTCKRVIVVCPCSLVKNWDNEFVKWLGPGGVKTLALAEADRKTVEKNIDIFVRTKMFNILIASYECIRAHIGRLTKHRDCCDLLVCDEAHRLKNSDNQTSQALNSLPVKRRVLLTGTPMQNDLQEFYAMVDFTNAGILGTAEEFRRNMLFPILRGREPHATDSQKRRMMEIQNDMSTTVNEFILRRVNTLNAQHLPPKLVQVVCCNLTSIQQNMYQHLVNSKDMQHVLDGKQVNCLASIQMLMKLCNHPSLIADEDKSYGGGSKSNQGRRAASSKTIKYNDDEKETTAAPGAAGVAKYMPYVEGGGGGRRGDFGPVHPEWSGKMFVLYRLMKEMRRPGNGQDKIVIISNYTQTLDLIGRMCRENSWGACRLDGSVTMKKRQKMVDEFNDPNSSLVAFLLSSKAGGCGLNLIGGNRLVLFDPDWNPAVDKQAAARCWRDGQRKRCFTYRFLATGTVEEKIFQRQLAKEGLQSVVDDKEQVNALSTKDLRNLFKLRTGTPSDTHDKLKCERCEIIHDCAEMEEMKVLPKKLSACKELLDEMEKLEDARHFLKPLVSTEYGITKEEYEKLVKQPMDLGTIRATLFKLPDNPSAYKNVSSFSKDVNRIFGNVLKVWNLGDEIADAARRLQTWWCERWGDLVPVLMTMKAADDDEDPAKSEGAKVESDDILAACANVNNERGDNYQEQIGMPDEENMRDWSHHYSADTVDDPIFRAAMRGCDNVSFVFGLEVTWSLIQQRQQEEEERLAMEALQNMEEEEEEEEEEKVEQGTYSKPMTTEEEEQKAPSSSPLEEESEDSDDDEEMAEEQQSAVPTEQANAMDSDDDDDDGPMKKSSSEEVDLADSDDDDEPVQKTSSEEADLVDSDDEDRPVRKTFSSGLKKAVLEDSSSEDDMSVDEALQTKNKKTTDSSSEDEDDGTAEDTSGVGAGREAAAQKARKDNNIVMDSLATMGDSDSASDVGKENTPNGDQWQCQKCTLLNAMSCQSCNVCGTRKSGGRGKRKRSLG